jgi:uncharacterized protein
MIHPHTELRLVSPTIGLGLFATRPIPKGTVTWVHDSLDIELTPEQFRALPTPQRTIVDHYSFLDSRGLYVLCWDGGRYMNHACDATTVCFGTICDVALRDIRAGEELTCDYALLNIDVDLQCHCGGPNCRKVVRPGDLPRVASRLDALIQGVAPHLREVTQPLVDMMFPEQRARLEAVMKGGKAPSCLENQPPQHLRHAS